MYHALVMIRDPAGKVLINSALESAEFRVTAAETEQRGLDDILGNDYHLAFIGLQGGGMRNDPVFRSLSMRPLPVPCIVMADRAMEQEAALAVADGAFDYILNTDSPMRVRVAASRAVAEAQRKEETLRISTMLRQGVYSLEPAGVSSSMISAKALIEKAAASSGHVIIEGEPGTGKKSAARTIHSMGQRHEGPFVEASCNLVPESLLETEIYGVETGIYGAGRRIRRGRIEQAHGGTLYLEDIDTLTPMLMRRLLHTIRTGEVQRAGAARTTRVDVRFIASSTSDLEASVYSGSFPKELYEALGSLRIRIPALRTRRDDIPLLLSRFMDECAEKLGRRSPEMERAALIRLLEHAWPGNLDELRALAESLVRRGSGGTLSPADLPESIRLGKEESHGQGEGIQQMLASIPLPASGISLSSVLDNLERALIIKALNRAGGLQTEAASLLGLKRTTLLEKMKKKGIS